MQFMKNERRIHHLANFASFALTFSTWPFWLERGPKYLMLLLNFLQFPKDTLLEFPSIYVRRIFLSNQIIHKVLFNLCFWAPDTLINKIYQNLSNNRSGAQRQWLNKILWAIWFDKKMRLIYVILFMAQNVVILFCSDCI